MTRNSPARNPLSHSAKLNASRLWVAYTLDGRKVYLFPTKLETLTADVASLTKTQGRVLAVAQGAAVARELGEVLCPAPTQEEQAEALVGGLAASVALCKREVA